MDIIRSSFESLGLKTISVTSENNPEEIKRIANNFESSQFVNTIKIP
jgi:hypothetical protein